MNLDNMENFLKEQIAGKNTLPELVDAFEQMCRVFFWEPGDDDDLLLFETGNYNFTGEPSFMFDLVRQIPDGRGEYLQLHLDVHYAPLLGGIFLTRCMWSSDENFFSQVRSSKPYRMLQNKRILRVECYTEGT